MSELNTHLFELLRDATAKLPGVTNKRMFGSQGFFADDKIFGLIWKTGRIGLKLVDGGAYDEAMSRPGAEAWSPGGKMVMSGWVLMSEELHDDYEALAAWAKRACEGVLDKEATKRKSAPKKAAAKKSPAKKQAMKKPVAKKAAAKKAVAKKPIKKAKKR